MGRLDEKFAFVTGAGGGIGRSICERFLAEGACVAAADIDLAQAQAAVATRRSRLPKPEFQADLPVNERRADIAELFLEVRVLELRVAVRRIELPRLKTPGAGRDGDPVKSAVEGGIGLDRGVAGMPPIVAVP